MPAIAPCSLEAPELVDSDGKRRLMQKIKSAIAAAYQGIANTDEVVVLLNTPEDW
jgi:hypothetical protein